MDSRTTHINYALSAIPLVTVPASSSFAESTMHYFSPIDACKYWDKATHTSAREAIFKIEFRDQY